MGARGISPDYLARIYEGPIADAALSVDMAHGRLQALHELPETDTARIAAVEDALARAELQSDGLRAAGKAAMSTIEDFPPEDTLRAQMKMDLRPQQEIDTLFGHIEALNGHAASGNPVIAVLEPASHEAGSSEHGSVYFMIPPQDGRPAVGLDREEGEHYMSWRASRSYALGPADAMYAKAHPHSRPSDGRVETPIDAVTFVSDARGIPALVKGVDTARLANHEAGSAPAAVIYGDEAVDALVTALAKREEGLRPLLYGATQFMGLTYEGPGMTTDAAWHKAAEGFYHDLNRYVVTAISTPSMAPEDQSENFTLLSPEMQKFIDISDYTLGARIEDHLRGWAIAGVDHGEPVVKVANVGEVSDAWSAVWSRLRDKGFGELAERMKHPDQRIRGVAAIERQAFVAALDERRMPKRSDRRRIQRAIARIDARTASLDT
jgi:hypothetical protein